MFIFRLIGVLLPAIFTASYAGAANCGISTPLDFYYNAANDPAIQGAQVGVEVLPLKVTYDVTRDARRKTGFANVPAMVHASLQNYLVQHPQTDYIGFLLTQKSTNNAAVFSGGKITQSEVLISDKSAIALVPMGAVNACHPSPEVLYLIPEDATKVHEVLDDQVIKLPLELWEGLLTEVLRHNISREVSGSTLDELLDTERLDVSFTDRYQMLSFIPRFKLAYKEGSAASGLPTQPGLPVFDVLLPRYTDRIRDASASVQQPIIQNFSKFKMVVHQFNIDVNYPLLRRLGKGEEVDEAEVRSVMEEISGILTEAKPAAVLAQEYLETLKKKADASGEAGFQARYAETLRFVGDAEGWIDILVQNYMRYNDFLMKTPSADTNEGFQVTNIEATSHKVGDQCVLKTQKFPLKNLTYNGFGTQKNFAGDLYIQYQKYTDPIDKVALYKPLIYAIVEVSGLRDVLRDTVKKSLPASSCRHRYSFDESKDISIHPSFASLIGRVNVAYEKWVCEKYSWICVDHFKIRKCKKDIKTRIFSTNKQFEVFTHAQLDQGQLVLISQTPEGKSTQRVDLVEALQAKGRFVFDVFDFHWQNVSFKKASNGSLLLVLKGEGRPMRPHTACAKHKAAEGQK